MDQFTERLLEELDNRIHYLTQYQPTDTGTISFMESVRTYIANKEKARPICNMGGGCAHSIKCQSQGHCEYPDTI